MTNEQIVRYLQNINDRLLRNLNIVSAHLETFEAVNQSPLSIMRVARDELYDAANDVLLLKKAIAAKQELENKS